MPNGITDQTLANLRTAAALLLVCPGMAVTVGVADHTVVEARRPPVPETLHPVIPVCAFHRCVAKAHDLRRAGAQVQMVGVDGDLEPLIALHADDDGIRMVPGGAVRRTGDDRWYHLLALAIPVDVVETVTAEVVVERDVHVVLHVDRMLDVTVLVCESAIGDKGAARDALDAMEQIAAAATVEWMLRSLDPGEIDREADALFASPAGDAAALRRADAPSAGSVPAERSNP